MFDTLQFVEKYYQQDPSQETVMYADELEEGMVVLPSSAESREDVTHFGKEGWDRDTNMALLLVPVFEKALASNRWCRVTKPSEIDILGPGGNIDGVSFIGVYEDETERVITAFSYEGFLVKRFSIPDEVELLEEIVASFPYDEVVNRLDNEKPASA